MGAGRREGLRGSLSQRVEGGTREEATALGGEWKPWRERVTGGKHAQQRTGVRWVWPCFAPEKWWGLTSRCFTSST